MISQIRPALVYILLMTVLTGLIYPLGVTGLAEFFFPAQAAGSLIERGGKVVGSELIGQSFTSDKYFHGRPSATTAPDPNDASKTIPSPYNAANSSGSNLGPTSKVLIAGMKLETQKLLMENKQLIPVDLATSSGSGLDPHITPAAAEFQLPRVARARNLPETDVLVLMDKFTEPRLFGIIGEPKINVLKLNLALDELSQSKAP